MSRFSVKDMSAVARDEDGHRVVALLKDGAPTAVYAVSHRDGIFTMRKINVPQELVNEDVLTTIRYDDAGSQFPCIVKPSKVVPAAAAAGGLDMDDHPSLHGPVALRWQPCSVHGASHCYKVVPAPPPPTIPRPMRLTAATTTSASTSCRAPPPPPRPSNLGEHDDAVPGPPPPNGGGFRQRLKACFYIN